jgi:hypothetical protein
MEIGQATMIQHRRDDPMMAIPQTLAGATSVATTSRGALNPTVANYVAPTGKERLDFKMDHLPAIAFVRSTQANLPLWERRQSRAFPQMPRVPLSQPALFPQACAITVVGAT